MNSTVGEAICILFLCWMIVWLLRLGNRIMEDDAAKEMQDRWSRNKLENYPLQTREQLVLMLPEYTRFNLD